MIIFTIAFGAFQVLSELRPFWVDEWRIIYNLKFKSSVQLWGQLDYMQQFPRVYLTLVKWFTNALDYSYFSLRPPSFIVGTLTIACAWRLMKVLYPTDFPGRYLLVLITVCSLTFSGYYVQTKQYTMDILMSFLSIWQLILMLQIKQGRKVTDIWYWSICLASFILPFFSYTYPIAFAPVVVIVLIHYLKSRTPNTSRPLSYWPATKSWLPIIITSISILIFYTIDIHQLMSDGGMQMFWGHLMLRDGITIKGLTLIPDLFLKILAPSTEAIIFGYVAFTALIYLLVKAILSNKSNLDIENSVEYYSLILIVFILLLFLVGKLPIGEARLNAFAVPAISIIMTNALRNLWSRKQTTLLSIVFVALYIAIIQNGVKAQLAPFNDEHYSRKLTIYWNTETALKTSNSKNLPILITPEVAYPYQTTRNFPYYDAIPGDWVLKTHPAYKANKHLPVWNINKMNDADSVFATLPHTKAAVAGNGSEFVILYK
jgi:hypothetical protein